MGSIVFKNGIRFVLLLIFQLLVFNKINLFGFLNPYPYILFILMYPTIGSRKALLLFSFLLGFSIDLFSDTGAVHAMASLLVAYLRPGLFFTFFGSSYDGQTLDLRKNFSFNVFRYMLFFTLIHHLIFFVISIFTFVNILDIFLRTFATTIFSLSIMVMLFLFFKPKRS